MVNVEKRNKRTKEIVYPHLKFAGIKTRISWTQIFNNKESGQKGWMFELSDGRTGRYILGEGLKIY